MITGAGRGRTALRWRLATTLVLCGGLLLSGCSDDSPESSKPKASGSATPSATTSDSSSVASASPTQAAATQAPRPPAPKRGRTGQKRFAGHVMAAWSYGLSTNDARTLTRLSPRKKPCEGCTAYAKELAKRRKQGWSVDFPGVVVRSVRLKQQGDGVTYARSRVDIPQSDSFNSNGSFRNTNQAHPGATFEVLMRYTKKGYRLLAFTVS
jgi:hypothetical protein